MSVDVMDPPEEARVSLRLIPHSWAPRFDFGPRPDPREGLISVIQIPLPNNGHCHFRQGEQREAVVPEDAAYFGTAQFMPNTRPEIEDGARALAYQAETIAIAAKAGYPGFRPAMSIMLTDETTPEVIYRARDLGVLIAKLYPKGATTNSGKGVSQMFGPRMEANYQAMSECGLVLSGHFEDPLGDIMDREADFIPVLDDLVRYFPHLRIIAEHVTTAELMAWVLRQGPQVACTVTPQHLVCTRNDVLGIQGLQDPGLPGGGPTLTDGLTSPAIRPHYYFLPVAHTMPDRRALILAAVSGNRKVCLGTDSAPHDVTAKECAYGCAGVFVPGKVALATLAWVFELCGPADWPRRLQAFACENWTNFHRLPPARGHITLRRQAWTVPARVAGFVPFAAEHTLPWEPFRDAD